MEQLVGQLERDAAMTQELYPGYPILGKHLPSTKTPGNSWFENEIDLDFIFKTLKAGGAHFVGRFAGKDGGETFVFIDNSGKLGGTLVLTEPTGDATLKEDSDGHGLYLEGPVKTVEIITQEFTMACSREPHPLYGEVFVLATVHPGRPDADNFPKLKKMMGERGLEFQAGTVVPLDILLATKVRVKGPKA